MILVGNQRGNSRDMANHLLKAENENVIVHEIRGFMGDDLHSAFQESYAISRATQCSQHLYSLSLNPPNGEDVSTAAFEEAIERAEQRLGLVGQSRAIVFHEKRGRDGVLRRHAHCVWCRIDTDSMKAVQLSFSKRKLNALGRELYLENGWDMPRGFENKAERSPLNFTHAEHQQARRHGKYADDIKCIFQSAWQHSDTKQSFAHALKEHGYVLAQGDKRSFVAVDHNGEVYSVPRTLGIKTKEVRERLGELSDFPSVEQAIEIAAKLAPSKFQKPAPQQNQQPQQPAESPIAKRLRRDPEHLLSMMTDKESVFSRHAIAKALNTYISDPDEYQAAYQTIIASNKLVQLTPKKELKTKARYSTREMVALEQKLMDDAKSLSHTSSFRVPSRKVELAIRITDKQLQAEAGVELSAEQRKAIRHITSHNQLSCVIGVAGSGKSTILAAAKEAWEANGHRVFGAALAGKAAKGLEQSSGIQSRTLASFELSWQNEVNQLRRGDVLVIDEAGMIGSRQLANFVTEAKDKGAKLVLVGDSEQLQPINAGAPFRVITEQIQPATLHEVHRQKQDWQKQASMDFALVKTQQALQAYIDHSKVDVTETHNDAVAALVSDYLNDFWATDNDLSQIALAHRKVDVKAINQTIREARKEAGELENGQVYKTEHGRREFAAGDRILFTRNNRDIGVKNGMLGAVVKADKHHLTIELDDKENGLSTTRTISIQDYADIEHGYATTIHKSQGATVDKSYVLASKTLDRHLTYVAMTRHKLDTKLYVNQEEFSCYAQLSSALSRKRQKLSTLDLQNNSSGLEREIFKQKRREQFQRRDLALRLH